jgi:hypothetical protein
MRSTIATCVGLALSLACAAGSAAAMPYMVQFTAGSYPIADSCPSAPSTPCVLTTDANLQVAISGVTADFTVTVGSNTVATFTLPDYLAPTGVEPGRSPYFSGSNLTDTSWDKTTYPYVVFWSPADGGGITIGESPDDNTGTLVTLFNSEQTTGASYTLSGTPEPMTWSLMIVGTGLTGVALRRRRARTA